MGNRGAEGKKNAPKSGASSFGTKSKPEHTNQMDRNKKARKGGGRSSGEGAHKAVRPRRRDVQRRRLKLGQNERKGRLIGRATKEARAET